MTDVAIRAEELGKRYPIHSRPKGYRTLRETLAGAFGNPFSFRRRFPVAPRETIWALQGVSFDLRRGEVLGIIGRNGAGKSTLLRILSRITEPSAGAVEITGRVGSLLEVGTGFHPELSGRENVYLNGAILGMKRAEVRRQFDEIVAFADIARFVDTPVKHYSSGMYVRLAFAVAAHLETEILLVDEVLAVGDVAFQKRCLGKVQEISQEGRTVIVVSHNMPAITSLAARCLLLEGGRLRFQGGTQEAVKKYMESVHTTGRHSWEVGGAPRRKKSHGEQVRITKIAIHPQNSDGFWFGEDLRFRVDLQAAADCSYIFAGAGIDDLYGTRLLTLQSHEVEFSLAVEKGKGYSVELQIPRPFLNPGRYFLSVSLYSGNIYFDLLFHAASFEIAPRQYGSGEYFEPIPGAGPLRLPYRWNQIEPSSPPSVQRRTAGMTPAKPLRMPDTSPLRKLFP